MHQGSGVQVRGYSECTEALIVFARTGTAEEEAGACVGWNAVAYIFRGQQYS